MATWDEWSTAYEDAYRAVPDPPRTPCPNCGHNALRLVFTGNLVTAIGYASFWCDHCLQGIFMSRTPIPDGAVARSSAQAPEDRRPTIPDFTLVT
jgi:hypothetical protein